jgi:hypothetical protein
MCTLGDEMAAASRKHEEEELVEYILTGTVSTSTP